MTDRTPTEATWKLVPAEPTPEMLGAFWRQKNCGTQEIGATGGARSDVDAYRAMLAASPPAPAAEPMAQYRTRFRPVGGDWGKWEGWFDGAFPPEDHPQFETQTRTLYTHPLDAAAIRAEARREAVEEAAMVVAGACTAINGKHFLGFPHADLVAKMVAERDLELAASIRALADKGEAE